MLANLFEPEPGVFVRMKTSHFGERQGFYLVTEDEIPMNVYSSVTWNPVTMQMNDLPPDEYVMSETFIRSKNRKLVRECLDYLSEDKTVTRYINGCPAFRLRPELQQGFHDESKRVPDERRLA